MSKFQLFVFAAALLVSAAEVNTAEVSAETPPQAKQAEGENKVSAEQTLGALVTRAQMVSARLKPECLSLLRGMGRTAALLAEVDGRRLIAAAKLQQAELRVSRVESLAGLEDSIMEDLSTAAATLSANYERLDQAHAQLDQHLATQRKQYLNMVVKGGLKGSTAKSHELDSAILDEVQKLLTPPTPTVPTPAVTNPAPVPSNKGKKANPCWQQSRTTAR